MSQLRELAKPIPKGYLTKSPKGMDAVDHTVITQLLHLRVPGWSMEIVETLRTQVPEIKTSNGKLYAGGLFVTGVLLRLTCEVDGNRVVIEEVGGVENAALKDGDGERMKHALSDALKRCAMRLGLGLHVWAQQMYFLDRAIDAQDKDEAVADAAPAEGTPAPVDPDEAQPVGPRLADADTHTKLRADLAVLNVDQLADFGRWRRREGLPGFKDDDSLTVGQVSACIDEIARLIRVAAKAGASTPNQPDEGGSAETNAAVPAQEPPAPPPPTAQKKALGAVKKQPAKTGSAVEAKAVRDVQDAFGAKVVKQ